MFKSYFDGLNLKYGLLCFGVFFIFLGASSFYISFEGNISENKENIIKINIEQGMSLKDIGALLESKGVIANSNRFWIVAKLSGYEKKIMAGKYHFHEGMKTEAALLKLIEGEVEEKQVVIPEGFTVRQIAKRLQEEEIIEEKEFLNIAKKFRPFNYIEANANVEFYPEGFLFPATYKINSDATAEDILNLMTDTFDKRLTPEMRKRAKERGISIYELIILASLVEKEAKYKEDQAIIAQVFFKRLKIGMPLQSDATLQYLMDAPKEDVSISDTKISSPYNTYQHYGLPPGPIANPGIEAINAALYPADTDYLYFVADRDGHNHYTTNYSSHLDKVNEVR